MGQILNKSCQKKNEKVEISVQSKIEVVEDLKKLEQTQNLLDVFPKYENVYKYLEKKQHRVYGDIYILAETVNPSIQIGISESFFQNTFEFEYEVENLKQLESQEQQHQNIIQLIQHFNYTHNSMCTTFHRLITVTEYHARDLSTELFFRKLLIERKIITEEQNSESSPQTKNSSILQSSFSKGKRSLSTNSLAIESQHKKKNSVYFGQSHIKKSSVNDLKKKSFLYVQEVFHPSKQDDKKDLIDESYNSQKELEEYFEDKRSNFNYTTADNQFRFQEKEFVYIMKSLISALCFLQKQNKSHQCIRSSSIFISRDGTIKLTDPQLFNQSSIYSYIYKGQSVSGGYLSPLLVENVEYSVIKPEHNPYKSDVFTLGALLLEIAYLNKLDNYFDYEQKCIIDLDGLDMLVDGLSDIYSQQTINIIQSMLEENEDKRPDFVSLAEQLGIFNANTNVTIQPIRSDTFGSAYSNGAESLTSSNQKNILQVTSIVVPQERQSLSQSPTFNRSLESQQQITIQQIKSQIIQPSQQNQNKQSQKQPQQCQLEQEQIQNQKSQQQSISKTKQNQQQLLQRQQSNQSQIQQSQKSQDLISSPKITKIESSKKTNIPKQIQIVSQFNEESAQKNDVVVEQQQKRVLTPIRSATFAQSSPMNRPIIPLEEQESIKNPLMHSTPKNQNQQQNNESYRYMTPLPQIRLSTPDNTTIQKQLFQMNSTPIANTKKILFSKNRGISTIKTESTATDIQFTQKTETTIDMQRYQARSTSPILRHQSSPSKQPITPQSKINKIIISEYSPNYSNNYQSTAIATEQSNQNRQSLSPMSKNIPTYSTLQSTEKGITQNAPNVNLVTFQITNNQDSRGFIVNSSQNVRNSISTPNDIQNKQSNFQIGVNNQKTNPEQIIIQNQDIHNIYSQPSVITKNQYQPKKSISVLPTQLELSNNLEYKFNNPTPIGLESKQENQPTMPRTYSTNNMTTITNNSRSPSPITSKSTQKIKKMISQADDKSPTGTPVQITTQIRQSQSQIQSYNSNSALKILESNKYVLSSLTPQSQKPPSLRSSQTQNKTISSNLQVYTPTNQVGQNINGQYNSSYSTANRINSEKVQNLSYNAINSQNNQSGLSYLSVLNNQYNQKNNITNNTSNQRKSVNVEPITHKKMSNSKIPLADNQQKLGSYEQQSQQSLQSSSNNKTQTDSLWESSSQLKNSTNQIQKSHRYSQSGNQFQYRSKTEIGNDQDYITSANQKQYDKFFNSNSKPPTVLGSEQTPITNQLANYQKQQSEQNFKPYIPRMSINGYKQGNINTNNTSDKQQQNQQSFIDHQQQTFNSKLIGGLDNIKPASELFRNKSIQQSTDLKYKQTLNQPQSQIQQKPPSLKSSLSLSKSQSSTKLNQQMTNQNTKTDLKQSDVGQKELTMSYIDRELEKHKLLSKKIQEDMERQKQQQFVLQTQMQTPNQINQSDFTTNQQPKFEKEQSLNKFIDQHVRDCSHHLQPTNSELSAPSISHKQIPSQKNEEQIRKNNTSADEQINKFLNQNHNEVNNYNNLKQNTYEILDNSKAQFQTTGHFITEQNNNNPYNKTCTFGEQAIPQNISELQKNQYYQEEEKVKKSSPPKEFDSEYIDQLIAKFKKDKTKINFDNNNGNINSNFRNQIDDHSQSNNQLNQISQNMINDNNYNLNSNSHQNTDNQVNYDTYYNPYSEETYNTQNNTDNIIYGIESYNNIQIDYTNPHSNDNKNSFYNTKRNLNNEFSNIANTNQNNNNSIQSNNNDNSYVLNMNNKINNSNHNNQNANPQLNSNNRPSIVMQNNNSVANTNGTDSNSNNPSSSERAIKRVESSCIIPAPSHTGQPQYSQKAPLPLGSNKYRTSIGGNDDRRISQDYVAGSRGELYSIPKSPNSYIKQHFTEISSIPLSLQQRADALSGLDFQDLKGKLNEQLKNSNSKQNEGQYENYVLNQYNSGSSSLKQVNSMIKQDKKQSRDRVASKDMTNSINTSVSNNNHSIQIMLPQQDIVEGIQQQQIKVQQNNSNYGITLIEDQNFINNNIIGDLNYYVQQSQNKDDENGQFLQTNFSEQMARQQTFGPNSPLITDAIKKGNLSQEQSQQLMAQLNSQTISNFPFNSFTQSSQSNDKQNNPSLINDQWNQQRDSGIDQQISKQKEQFQQLQFITAHDTIFDKDKNIQNQNLNFESTFAQNDIKNYDAINNEQQLHYQSNFKNGNYETQTPQHTPLSGGTSSVYQLSITPPKNNSSILPPPIQEQAMFQKQKKENHCMFIDDQQIQQQQQYYNQMIEGCQNISNIQQVNEDDTYNSKRSLEATDDVFLMIPSNQNIPEGGVYTINIQQEDNHNQNNNYQQNSESNRYTTPFNLQSSERHKVSRNYQNASESKNNTFTISPKKDESMFNQTFSELQMIQFLKSKENVIETYEDGSYYEGEKMNGVRHGRGKFYYGDGGSFQGEWQNGHMNGYGILYYPSQNKAYEGEWDDDKFNGKGIMYNERPIEIDGMFNYHNMNDIHDYWIKYEGDFKDDFKNGVGTLYLSNGERYIGRFKNDMIHGNGTFYKIDGSFITAEWSENIFLNYQ